ncbi:RagB/SusD family nutrient uptake outer membrane protein [Mangrovibacterium diazotrophicum]|uniref:Putative outer membrane starch-binding protein n=1 Tax=Mangrovibacterium diazotrophicum TaxID=1261403 RepID=A0A419WA67_9BACT|nr:RagB/SusD family nutrient uptake outer membrane protein [Mangrovibacterium diazotrophicum]RKD92370.1 putative outer membrane starch-binding protein [Mangrovibacterium diazotrophicum]
MKYLQFKNIIGTALLALFFVGCSDILDETPRATFTPEYFKTQEGAEGGLTYLYSNLRYMFGNGYFLNAYETGTDEYTYGFSADEQFKAMDFSGAGVLTSANSNTSITWEYAFKSINTANGIIQYGTDAGVSDALIAEAKFFRAFNYFLLVQTFGGVPLDLGSGELAFNTSPSRTSVRNTVAEVYTTAIFPDLLDAIDNLPDEGRATGTATTTLARLFLAKAYLTYAWWLENPNNIATYPVVDSRTDPDGQSASWYFQEAYNVAVTAIDNPGPFSLQTSFYQVHVGSNDRHSEMLLYADHTEDSEYYDGSSHSYNSGSAPGNFAAWFPNWNYSGNLTSYTSSGSALISTQREEAQPYGRPWSRMSTPIGVFEETFADKTYDSRYDGTFNTVFRGNWQKNSSYSGSDYDVLYNANDLPVVMGDPVLTFLGEDSSDITYPSSSSDDKSGMGAGTLPGRADWVVGPSAISRFAWPTLWKLGPYVSTHEQDGGLGSPNSGITRPFPIAKLSELYLVAAEAAVKGASGTYSAVDLVNVLRARAGVWTYSNSDASDVSVDYSSEMIANTPSSITIDYILAERSREFFGEGYRWLDLVRTQKWGELAGEFDICSDASKENAHVHDRETYSRTISEQDYLRPIPSSQIDGLEMSDTEKEAYQNPGY